jgi:serine/threonine-protein kinase
MSFVAVPPRYAGAGATRTTPDWSPLLAEAGVDANALTQSTPRWAAPVDSDVKAAWDVPAQPPQPPLHIEAAAYHGRVVYFEVQGPWAERPRESRGDSTVLMLALLLAFLLLIPVVAGGIVLVRRNLRMGRGDRRGAFRLALVMFFGLVLAHLCRADHTSVGAQEYALLIAIVSQGCYGALAIWSLYLALEPPVRRRWPHTLISWNRLLAGRLRDPLVARDVLVGILLGLAVLLNGQLADEVASGLGRLRPLNVGVMTTLSSAWHLGWYFFVGICMGVVHSVAILFTLYLAHSLVRRMWLALPIVGVFLFVPALSTGADPLLAPLKAAVFSGLILFALSRFGLLTTTVTLFSFVLLSRAPLTFDPSAWYFGRSFAVLLFFAAALAASAYLTLGGKPLFGRALLED